MTAGHPAAFGRSPRLSAQVLGALLAEIVERWEPGSLLPRETDLAQKYSISRGVTREVLRGLEERGVVTVRHGHGAIVNHPDRWDILDESVLQAVLLGPDGVTVLREVLECRRLLEVHVASLAATRARPEDLAAIEAALEDMRVAAGKAVGENDLYLEADLRFHKALAQAANNRALFRIAEPLQRAFLTAHRPLAHPDVRTDRSVPEHANVLRAIQARNPVAAAAAMELLLVTVQGYLEEAEAEQGSAAARPARAVAES